MLDSIINSISQLHGEYTEQLLTALVLTSLTVMLHGQGMDLAMLFLKRFRSQVGPGSHGSVRNLVIVTVVAIMLLTHFFEILAWATFYFLTDMLKDIKLAMYFSINSYTTLGASNLTLPGRWQGLGGFEAMTGMLMFGWSTAVLAAVAQKIHNLDD